MSVIDTQIRSSENMYYYVMPQQQQLRPLPQHAPPHSLFGEARAYGISQ